MSGGYWYNFRTKEYEVRETPEEWADYLPQLPAAQGLFEVLVLKGKDPLDAAFEVLAACAGKRGE